MTDFAAMNAKVIDEFRANGGEVGGMFANAPLILVHHFGAKSGTERIAPLVYLAEGERLFVFASKGGSPENPAWYHNLLAHPEVTVEVGEDTFPVRATVLDGAERDRVYTRQAAAQPQFAEYQEKTDRLIPVVELVRR
ncbi:nitroreductase family deazaflavin-dependent oxidoreductase [Amycolatopsis antarctica]|uniref:Nitroreductase family deazaflavin-dependent oxidoreductase n=1 Tax=Amycolatopsis antarctica TaxID=1854586 RepID=A0A263D275_9PSEU|nr:nitroreductase family deazaflavin-dependent oxidoreductase [Amycolatopsis antarctica]OZM71737.1 nitroreductase family deazaflavin-dependent oxidoreductase [Amycolatopsis antarctica]